MSHTIRKQPNYVLIGTFMAIGLLGILVSVVFADKLVNRLKGGYAIYIKFNELDGLVPGSKVVVGSGKNIGQVETIELDGPALIVKVLIDKKYKINQEATFEIFSTSFVGGKYLAVENYTGLEPFIERDTILQGVEPLSINSILGMFGDAFNSGTDEGMAVGISGIMGSVNDILNKANTILDENQTNIDITLVNVAAASKHLNSTMANIDRKLATVSDQEFKTMLTDVKRSLGNLDLFLKDINSKNAPLSILKDPKMTHSIRTIITNLEETTERVKAKPSLLLRG